MHGAEEVHRHDLAENPQAGFGEGTAVGDAGVIDQHVDAAEALHRQRHGTLHRIGVGDVAAQAERLAAEMVAQVLDQTVQRRLVEVEDRQSRTGPGETQRQRATDAGTAAADQHHLVAVGLAAEYLARHAVPSRSKKREPLRQFDLQG